MFTLIARISEHKQACSSKLKHLLTSKATRRLVNSLKNGYKLFIRTKTAVKSKTSR